ncbi:uncharacterized protein AMSG_05672 [Thecamonas trahens ATCC 50062]|uniref:Uncharacterized protein n=1 Tax=Thecamonas trahens ATCC 50062 TaxID=461836 RepID=A0A0L0DE85_THETB|nr:hypothetical protein AMSG_05672 [Thecamonas trahens ATCC 50062]KNC49628.1 hypothetical protein AMSG_05672 [Thecamonas trahens ATCC 50062]|eukprot:XP_013757733.1 hypothetical protein AMSG_05672 [Thecamonas trahens ATCC 50062]
MFNIPNEEVFAMCVDFCIQAEAAGGGDDGHTTGRKLDVDALVAASPKERAERLAAASPGALAAVVAAAIDALDRNRINAARKILAAEEDARAAAVDETGERAALEARARAAESAAATARLAAREAVEEAEASNRQVRKLVRDMREMAAQGVAAQARIDALEEQVGILAAAAPPWFQLPASPSAQRDGASSSRVVRLESPKAAGTGGGPTLTDHLNHKLLASMLESDAAARWGRDDDGDGDGDGDGDDSDSSDWDP